MPTSFLADVVGGVICDTPNGLPSRQAMFRFQNKPAESYLYLINLTVIKEQVCPLCKQPMNFKCSIFQKKDNKMLCIEADESCFPRDCKIMRCARVACSHTGTKVLTGGSPLEGFCSYPSQFLMFCWHYLHGDCNKTLICDCNIGENMVVRLGHLINLITVEYKTNNPLILEGEIEIDDSIFCGRENTTMGVLYKGMTCGALERLRRNAEKVRISSVSEFVGCVIGRKKRYCH